MSVQVCPKCGGQGTQQKPPWVAGDQQEWSSSNTALYPCAVCDGSRLIAVSGD